MRHHYGALVALFRPSAGLNWSNGYCASSNPVNVGGTATPYNWWLQFCSAGTGSSGGSILSESSSICKVLLSIATGSTAVRIIIGITAFFLALSVISSVITAVRLCSPNAAAAIATRGSAGCCAPSQSGCCGCCGPTSFDAPCTSVGLLSASEVLVIINLIAWGATLGVSIGFLSGDPATMGNTTSSLGSNGYGTMGASLVFMLAALIVQAMLHSRLNWLKGMAQNAAAASMAGSNGSSSSVVIMGMGGHAATVPQAAPGAVMAAAYGQGYGQGYQYQMGYPQAGVAVTATAAGGGGATVVANPFQAAAAAAAYQQQAQAQAQYGHGYGYGAPMPSSPGGGHTQAALATPLMAHGAGPAEADHDDPSDVPHKAKSASGGSAAATAPAASAPPVASAPVGGYYGAPVPAAGGYYGAPGAYYLPAGTGAPHPNPGGPGGY